MGIRFKKGDLSSGVVWALDEQGRKLGGYQKAANRIDLYAFVEPTILFDSIEKYFKYNEEAEARQWLVEQIEATAK